MATFDDETTTCWRDLTDQLRAWQIVQLQDREQIGDPPHVLFHRARAFAAENP